MSNLAYAPVRSVRVEFEDGLVLNTDLFGTLPLLGAKLLHEHAIPHGFRDEPRSLERELMLIASEAFEAFEDYRKNKVTSDKIPNYSPLEEEFADILIRVLESAAWRAFTFEQGGEHEYQTFAKGRGFALDGATRAKHAFNLNRPHKHGKAF